MVEMRFARDDVDYASLSEEEKAQWEETDRGDEPNDLPATRVYAPAINNWLFNPNTVDLVLKQLMQHGHHVEGGDRLFRARIELVGHLQANKEHDPDTILRETLTDTLYSEVEAMSRDNFIVRMQLEAVERFQDRNNWQSLSDTDRATLSNNVAGLPTALETDDIESRLFDLTALRMQLALLEGNTGGFETARRRVTEIAQLLEDKSAIPAVAEQLSYLVAIQETEFWEGIDLIELEDLRERLRGLVPLLDKSQRTIVYTQFQDEVLDIRSEVVIDMPKMTGVQYEKKVRDYLNSHRDHLVIHRLRTNQPLTATDLEGLGKTLAEIGEEEGETLLTSLVEHNDAPTLA